MRDAISSCTYAICRQKSIFHWINYIYWIYNYVFLGSAPKWLQFILQFGSRAIITRTTLWHSRLLVPNRGYSTSVANYLYPTRNWAPFSDLYCPMVLDVRYQFLNHRGSRPDHQRRHRAIYETRDQMEPCCCPVAIDPYSILPPNSWIDQCWCHNQRRPQWR